MVNSYNSYHQVANLRREVLIGMLEDAAKNWLAHDGLWFQAVERRFGIEEAILADEDAWRQFTVIEAKRIMQRHGIPYGSGIPGLVKALGFRFYAFINRQEISVLSENRIVFTMKECRVQAARKRKGLPDFPCRSVGLVEYTGFARTIDERIETRCIFCPPDEHPEDAWCSWEFQIK